MVLLNLEVLSVYKLVVDLESVMIRSSSAMLVSLKVNLRLLLHIELSIQTILVETMVSKKMGILVKDKLFA